MLEQPYHTAWYTIAFVLRSLTPAKQNYIQIEKEILPILFAYE